jgi:cytochrome bd-type quinol oxidase subunit 2
MTLATFLSLFNIFVGLFLVATLIVYGAAFVSWVARFGTWPSYRDTSIRALEWAVGMAFMLVVLLGIVQYFQQYPKVMATIVAGIVILALVFMLLRAAAKKPEKKPSDGARR